MLIHYFKLAYNALTIYSVVSKLKTDKGGIVNMSLTTDFFPSAGQLNVFHTYRETRIIFTVSSSGVSYGDDKQSAKYTYLTKPFVSTTFLFEIRNITLDDAGYYNGGVYKNYALLRGGVVLIVTGKIYHCIFTQECYGSIWNRSCMQFRDIAKLNFYVPFLKY